MGIDISWNIDDRRDWDAHFNRVPRSNLLQSWAYGEAKRRAERFHVRRGALHHQGQVLGIVQALERRFGLARLVRINRGPLWTAPVGPDVIEAAFAALRSSFRLWKRQVLSIAPEIENGAFDRFETMGYRRRSAPAWSSAWVDLSMPVDQLRKRLGSKWRNLLNAGERAGVMVRADHDDAAFAWIVARYQDLIRERGFRGISVDVVRELWALRDDPSDMLVYRSYCDDRGVAGALIVRHGTTATYLIGWSDPEGRRIRAMNVLLFGILGDLAARGCAWLDLGGIDKLGTPGIAHFKQGIGGSEYTLAGEFLSL
jgi:Acetyltransferase (GNAT) domain